jgi:hypothetical protein
MFSRMEDRIPDTLVDAASAFAGHQVSRRAALGLLLIVLAAVVATVVLTVIGVLSSFFASV